MSSAFQKLLFVIYDSGIDEDVQQILDEQHLAGWTKLFDAHGLGGVGKKQGDPIWPGTNNLLLIALADDQIPPLVRALENLKASFRRNPGISVFSLPVEVLGGSLLPLPDVPRQA